MSKPCFQCGQPSELTAGNRWFDPAAVFDDWASSNSIICPDRCRFDGVRECLDWASLDENEVGAHASCALRWAVEEEGYGERYPHDFNSEATA